MSELVRFTGSLDLLVLTKCAATPKPTALQTPGTASSKASTRRSSGAFEYIFRDGLLRSVSHTQIREPLPEEEETELEIIPEEEEDNAETEEDEPTAQFVLSHGSQPQIGLQIIQHRKQPLLRQTLLPFQTLSGRPLGEAEAKKGRGRPPRPRFYGNS